MSVPHTPGTRRRRLIGAGSLPLLLAGCSIFGDTVFPTAEVGECVDTATLVSQLDSALSGEVTELSTVECTEAHDGEVYFTQDMPDGAYPGDAAVESATEACSTEFENYVGVDASDSGLSIFSVYPIENSWELGDREILCIAYLPDGGLTGSIRGSKL